MLAAVALPVVSLLAGCASAGSASSVVRLGYLPTLSQAPGLIAVAKGFLAHRLGPGTSLQVQSFSAGPACLTAVIVGSLDGCFSGPSPAINAFVRSEGQAVRIVAGATYGGAGLVVRRDARITTPGDLRGRTLAAPQLGNTQDVALRAYLSAHGLATDPEGGGDVKVISADNGIILQLFQQGRIDGAWVPEPYLSRLELQGGGSVLVDEASQWPGGRFETTSLVVATSFLASRRDLVRDAIEALADAIADATAGGADAQTFVNTQLASLTQASLARPVLSRAWGRLHFSLDPIASSLRRSAANAQSAGLLSPAAHLEGIYDLTVANEVARARGQPALDAGGLGPA